MRIPILYAMALLACSRDHDLKPDPATCTEKQTAISIDLPHASTGREVSIEMRLAITKTGETFIDGERASDDDIKARARTARAKTPETRAVILADKDATHGRVIKVLDLLRQEGIDKIAFGVQPVP